MSESINALLNALHDSLKQQDKNFDVTYSFEERDGIRVCVVDCFGEDQEQSDVAVTCLKRATIFREAMALSMGLTSDSFEIGRREDKLKPSEEQAVEEFGRKIAEAVQNEDLSGLNRTLADFLATSQQTYASKTQTANPQRRTT